MAAEVKLVCGPARSGKTERLLIEYRRALVESPGGTLWLAPTQRVATLIRGRLLEGNGPRACLSPGVMTFAQFASAVLQASPQQSRPLTAWLKRRLIAGLIDEANSAGRLGYFSPIAGTAGLVDLVCELIGELKRLEIWPEEFQAACERRGLGEKDRELLAIYSQYQSVLKEHQLYDAEGRFWSARALLRDGQTRPFERLSAVVVDGFTDFTRTQHEILEILAELVRTLAISLPYEPQVTRGDLFAKSAATLERLLRLRPRPAIETIDRAAVTRRPSLAHLEAELFLSPRELARRESPRDASEIEVLGAPRALGEIEMIGRRIKRLLVEGEVGAGPLRPGDVAVVFRSLTEVAPLIREVFGELGLPYALESGLALNSVPAISALVSLLELDRDDWPFRRLLAVLSNNYFQPIWPSWRRGAAPAERAIRGLQLPSGRRELLDRLARLAEVKDSQVEEAYDERRRERAALAFDAALALPLLTRLDQALGALPAQATPRAWVEALNRLADVTGLSRAAGEPIGDDRPAARDGEALERLGEVLAAEELLAAWMGESPASWTRTELLDRLTDAAASTELPPLGGESGKVRVLSAVSARGLEFNHLFFAGLAERAFPPPGREDRLYSEAESEQLHAAGLPLVLRAERSQEEMLLFYEVATRASERLYLSYPAVDNKGQPLLPSPYLEDLERVFDGGGLTRTIVTELSPLPRDAVPACRADLRLTAVDRALHGDSTLLAASCQDASERPVAENIVAGLSLADARSRRDEFGPYEGMLAGPSIAAAMAPRFGLDRVWSVSDLESYASCPFRFFLERVLRIEPLAEPLLEDDFANRGRLLHGTLAELHRRLNQDRGGPTSPLDDAEGFAERLRAALTSLLGGRGDGPLATAIEAIDAMLVTNWAHKYLADYGPHYLETWKGLVEPPRPAHFEVSFGLAEKAGDPLSTEEPLVVAAGGDEVRLGGKIDRLDLGSHGNRPLFNVLDYKSGRTPTKKAIQEGLDLQLAVYALAAQRVLLRDRGALPAFIGYWAMKQQRPLVGIEPIDVETGESAGWEGLAARLTERIVSLVRGIRGGEFPVHSADADCTSHCSYSTACRVNQVRSLEKAWQPPSVAIR